jgi:hypothetical protein
MNLRRIASAAAFATGAALAFAPLASADNSSDVASAIDSLVSGLPAAATTTDYLDISYDGKTIFDNFPGALSTFGMSDAGTAAESGVNGDFAEVYGPSTDNIAGLANDSATNDSNDIALYDGAGTTGPTSVLGQEGATIVNGTNSDAEVYGGGNATINDIPANGANDLVSNSSAFATNGGFAAVNNDGNAPTITVSNDDAYAFGTATNTGAATPELGAGTTPSVAYILDSGNSVAEANDTGSNLTVGYGGAAVDLANNGDAYAVNAGSSSDIEGGVVNGVPFTNDTPISNVADYVGNSTLQIADMSNLYEVDGIPDATFFADLFGVNGAAAFSTAYTDLLGLF